MTSGTLTIPSYSTVSHCLTTRLDSWEGLPLFLFIACRIYLSGFLLGSWISLLFCLILVSSLSTILERSIALLPTSHLSTGITSNLLLLWFPQVETGTQDLSWETITSRIFPSVSFNTCTSRNNSSSFCYFSNSIALPAPWINCIWNYRWNSPSPFSGQCTD